MKFNLSQYYSLVLLLYVLVILAIIRPTAAAATSARPVVVPVEEEDVDTDVDGDDDEADNSSKDYWLMNTNNNISLIIHRNGEIDPCGVTGVITQENFISNLLPPSSSNKSKLNKYEIESRLTDNIFNNILTTSTMNDDDHGHQKHNNMDGCGPGDGRINNGAVIINDNDDNDDASLSSFYKHCDRGPTYTPILLDHQKLVRTTSNNGGSLPCRFYTREGLRITSLKQFTNLIIDHQQQQQQQQHSCANPQDDDEDSSFEECKNNNNNNDDNKNNVKFHLYAVPAGRVFIFAPSYIGEIFELKHMKLLPDVNK